MSNNPDFWWLAEKGAAHERVFTVVEGLAQRQSTLYGRFIKLEALYDPLNYAVSGEGRDAALGNITENLIASNVDTTYAAVASTDVGIRVETDGADWSTQRTARSLESYAEQLKTQHEVVPKCRLAFKESGKKGTGFVAVGRDQWDELKVEHVLPDDIVVPESDSRSGGSPRHLHRRKPNASKEALKQEFPELAEEIELAGIDTISGGSRRRRSLVTDADECLEIESWRLPIGKKGQKGYRPGRHTRSTSTCTLLDEKWDKPFFPIAKIVWMDRAGCYFGISLAERIAGHQRVVNKRHWQIDRQLDQLANPTTYVRPADANMAVQTGHVLGTVAVSKADYPHTVTPSPVSAQVFQHLEMMGEKSFQETGVSRMSAQAMKPAGVDSGVALREYNDKTTVRFAPQEEALEALVLLVVWLLIDTCKDLGDRAPAMMRSTRYGPKKLVWKDVDMGDFRVQLQAASTLSKTSAGREQQLIEWAQAGVITTDQFRRMVGHPDLEREMSLYTAAAEDIEGCLEDIANGKLVMPEPYMNAKMAVWRSTNQYAIWKRGGAPENVLEALRQFTVQAAWIVQQSAAPPANANMPPGAAAAGPDPGTPMPAAGGAPGGGPAQAALSPQAMQLVAGTG